MTPLLLFKYCLALAGGLFVVGLTLAFLSLIIIYFLGVAMRSDRP